MGRAESNISYRKVIVTFSSQFDKNWQSFTAPDGVHFNIDSPERTSPQDSRGRFRLTHPNSHRERIRFFNGQKNLVTWQKTNLGWDYAPTCKRFHYSTCTHSRQENPITGTHTDDCHHQHIYSRFQQLYCTNKVGKSRR
jgi:hypothetical protein